MVTFTVIPKQLGTLLISVMDWPLPQPLQHNLSLFVDNRLKLTSHRVETAALIGSRSSEATRVAHRRIAPSLSAFILKHEGSVCVGENVKRKERG